MRLGLWILALGTFALAGRGEKQDRERAAAGDEQRGVPGMGMDSMQMGEGHMGMGGMGGMGMMPMMRAHMDSMMRMSHEQMRAMMASHDRAMSQMMDTMGADMRNMKMTADPAWNALADSVRQDLAELPALEGQKLEARMRAHTERMRRLMATHEKMMQSMSK
jgi:hypothetical protein